MIDKIIQRAYKLGVNDAKVINPQKIKVHQWVRMKCQFGCPAYGNNYTCPPFTPPLSEVSDFLRDYEVGILMEFVRLEKLSAQKKVQKILIDLEKEAFLEGYYKAFGITAGSCSLCKKCKAVEGKPCYDMGRRPSLEALGIDVYELVNESGFELKPVHKKSDIFKSYVLLLLY